MRFIFICFSIAFYVLPLNALGRGDTSKSQLLVKTQWLLTLDNFYYSLYFTSSSEGVFLKWATNSSTSQSLTSFEINSQIESEKKPLDIQAFLYKRNTDDSFSISTIEGEQWIVSPKKNKLLIIGIKNLKQQYFILEKKTLGSFSFEGESSEGDSLLILSSSLLLVKQKKDWTLMSYVWQEEKLKGWGFTSRTKERLLSLTKISSNTVILGDTTFNATVEKPKKIKFDEFESPTFWLGTDGDSYRFFQGHYYYYLPADTFSEGYYIDLKYKDKLILWPPTGQAKIIQRTKTNVASELFINGFAYQKSRDYLEFPNKISNTTWLDSSFGDRFIFDKNTFIQYSPDKKISAKGKYFYESDTGKIILHIDVVEKYSFNIKQDEFEIFTRTGGNTFSLSRSYPLEYIRGRFKQIDSNNLMISYQKRKVVYIIPTVERLVYDEYIYSLEEDNK